MYAYGGEQPDPRGAAFHSIAVSTRAASSGGRRAVAGTSVHKLPADLRQELMANIPALEAWKDITPLARNEFIC